MDELIKKIELGCKGQIKFQKIRPGILQVYLPTYYEDGDMVDVFIKPDQGSNTRIFLTDCGTTLMKLSYTYDINTPAKESIFNKIIAQSGIQERNGELFLDSEIDQLFHSLMQITGCQQKILNMRMWQRETIRSLFMQELDEHIEKQMYGYTIEKNISPLPDYPVIEVDYKISHAGKTFYLFGVNNKDKAKTSAIALLEMEKAKLNYISMIVHESMESLPKKEQMYLTQNADKQFLSFADFQKSGDSFIKRAAA